MPHRKVVLFFGLFLSLGGFAQSFYDLFTIQNIELQFSFSDWDRRLDSAKAGSENFIPAQWVRINGIRYDSVGVKYKGNSSYDSTFRKNPVHIEMNTFKAQSHEGFTDIKLGNNYSDPSMIREVLSYSILQNYMKCPRANFARLYINGKYMGLYSNAESINKKFCGERFYSSAGVFIKCNPNATPGPTIKSNLKYIAGDSSQYFRYYEMKSATGWNTLGALCDTLSNHPGALSKVMHPDRALWMLAFNNLLINLDSYNGAFAQNYYLYRDATGLFNPIVWDLNMSFGAFPFAGSPNNGMGTLSIANMQQLPYTYHDTHTDWPLIAAIMANGEYKRMYVAHMRTLIKDHFSNRLYEDMASQMQTLIDTAVLIDSNKFYSDPEFHNAMNSNVNAGSYTIPGISVLMNARVNYLQSTADFKLPPPVISSVQASNGQPHLGEKIYLSASVTQAGVVYLYYSQTSTGLFTSVPMYDDGKHGDGSGGDDVYGAEVEITGARLSYYLYAENSQAGIFSPERAAHVSYELVIATDSVAAGDLVINEFLAVNDQSDINEYGIYSDWIELRNNSNKTIHLPGFYLSDNPYNLRLFEFGLQDSILPGAYKMIWADGLKSTARYPHSSFSLSGDGGEILLSDIHGKLCDRVSYEKQYSDHSTGRCPDGQGKFYPIKTPSFQSSNHYFCIAGTPGALTAGIRLYPNPARDQITLEAEGMELNRVEIYNAMGQAEGNARFEGGRALVDLKDYPPGIYFYQAGNEAGTLFVKGKFVKTNP